MKNCVLPTLSLLFTLSGVAMTGAAITDSTADAIRIVSGKVFLGEKVLVENFSLTQSKFSYLFIYAPGTGLFTVSNSEFPGAREAGGFNDNRLEIEIDGLQLRLEAGAPILQGRASSAWAVIDREFSLTVNAPMVGYGDDPSAPQAWQKYVGTGR
jgi:hypothetical protein